MKPPRTFVRSLATLPLLLGFTSCQDVGEHALNALAAQPSRSAFARYVTLRDSFALQENTDVVTVSPAVSIDHDGGFLVADAPEGQIRLYSAQGVLRHHFGSNGPGPGEFRSLAKAVRLTSGQILAADMSGKLALFDAEGQKVIRTVDSGVVPLYDAAVLDDRNLVLAGRLHGAMDSPLLHVFELPTGRVQHSFMNAPEHDESLDGAFAFTGFSAVAVRDSVIAGMFALSDSVQLFSKGGNRLGSVPVPYRNFRRLTQPLPQQNSRVEMQRWMEGFSTACNLFWLKDGSFLVQYGDAKEGDMRWRLLRMTGTGGLLFDVVDSPKLLAVSPSDSALYFVRPTSETLDLWSVGALRP